mgnify:CR=1 FL=1
MRIEWRRVRVRWIGWVIALIAVSSFVTAREEEGQAAPALADLAWMAGHWRSTVDDSTVEEVWLPSRGGLLVGMNRTSTARGSEFEFLRIDVRKGAITYLASPGGAAPTPFPLKSLDGKVVVFENPDHDFPKWIRYERKGDALTASIGGDEGEGMSWTWKLAAPLD